MNYNEMARILVELGIWLGLRDILKADNLRRGAANKFEGKSHSKLLDYELMQSGETEISANQYAQLLGHAVKVMGESYISNISAVDVQGIINDEPLRQDHIQKLRSMRLHLNPNAPIHLLFLECKAVLDNPELIQLDAHLKSLEEKRRVEGDSSELRQQHTQAT
jgi:hypothetical protein